MANKGICATRMNIGGRSLSFSTHRFYTLGARDRSGAFTLVRIRHYRDLAKVPVEIFWPYDADRSLPMVAVPDGLTVAPGNLLTGLVESIADEIVLDDVSEGLTASGCVFGLTGDARRIQVAHDSEDRPLTGEGGRGFRRPPAEELRLLAASDRASDAFYEPAVERAARRRRLVGSLRSRPQQIEAVLDDLLASRLRVPALTIAVDACAAGVYGASSLLAKACTRPDDLALVLQYCDEAYGSSVPSSVRRALATRAVELFDEEACVRFDRLRRRGVDDRSRRTRAFTFADVIRIARPRPRDAEQSRLFRAVLSDYQDVSGLPLLQARRDLLAAGPSAAADMLATAAARVATGTPVRGPGAEPLSRLPWQLLVAATSTPRLDVVGARTRRAAAEAEVADHLASSEVVELRRVERRLRSRVRDARTGSPSARTEAWRAHREFRESPEFRSHRTSLRTLRSAAAVARQQEAALRSRPGVVNPDVWRLALPSMSAAETLANLAAVERSGAAEELLPVVESRLAARPVSLPDVLRTVRGLSLGALRSTAGQTPHRSEWAAAPASVFEPVLERALDARLDVMLGPVSGRVLILVDGSGSMGEQVSARRNDRRAAEYSSANRAEVAAFAAAAIARNCQETPDVYVYDTKPIRVDLDASDGVFQSVRKTVGAFRYGGTDTFAVLEQTFSEHDLVVILTDEQTSSTPGQRASSRRRPYRPSPSPTEPAVAGSRFVVVNLAGYEAAQMPAENVTVISGWSESIFDVVAGRPTA